MYSTSTKGRQEVDKGGQEREEVLLGESSSGHSEASCQESTPQIWLPTADIEQDQEGVSSRFFPSNLDEFWPMFVQRKLHIYKISCLLFQLIPLLRCIRRQAPKDQ